MRRHDLRCPLDDGILADRFIERFLRQLPGLEVAFELLLLEGLRPFDQTGLLRRDGLARDRVLKPRTCEKSLPLRGHLLALRLERRVHRSLLLGSAPCRRMSSALVGGLLLLRALRIVVVFCAFRAVLALGSGYGALCTLAAVVPVSPPSGAPVGLFCGPGQRRPARLRLWAPAACLPRQAAPSGPSLQRRLFP